MIPVVEMLRVSTETQSEGAGLPAQHAVNLRTASAHGLEIVEAVEIVVSGAEVATTPGMARVLEAVTSGRARGILLAEYSRLFRPDRWSDLIVLQTLSDHDARIYLPSGPIDLQSELGFVQATINNLLAAMERRRIRERMERGKEEHRRRGAHVAGGVGIPFGMRYTKEGGWSWTEDAEVVRLLFRRFLSGERRYDALSAEFGLPRTTTKFLLQNPVYTGWRVYDEKRDLSPAGKRRTGDRRTVARRPDEVIRVRLPLEPLVSEADFALVQELIATKEARRVKGASEVHLYRGMLACTCGLRCYTFANGRGHHFYYCRSWNPARRPEGGTPCPNGYMERKRLEGLLDAAITERLTDPGLLTRAVSEYLRTLQAEWRQSQPDPGAFEERIRALEQKKARILESYYDGVITKADRDARLVPLLEEIETTRRILGAAPAASPEELAEPALIALVETFAAWSHVDRAGRRSILEALSPTFYVRKYGVDGVRFPLGLLPGGHTDGHPQTTDRVTTSSFTQTTGGLYVPLCA